MRGAQPINLPVQPEADAVVDECLANVQAKIGRDGGQMRCGWQLWEWPHVLVGAEFHRVWVSAAGELVDITPKPEGETRIFVPEPRRRHEGLAIETVGMPSRGDLLIRHFTQMSEATMRVMSCGEWATQHKDLVLQALLSAVWRSKRSLSLLLHSDQGAQFTSEGWQSLLHDHKIVCSMSRGGNFHENAALLATDLASTCTD